jgi:hypothetical protein
MCVHYPGVATTVRQLPAFLEYELRVLLVKAHALERPRGFRAAAGAGACSRKAMPQGLLLRDCSLARGVLYEAGRTLRF